MKLLKLTLVLILLFSFKVNSSEQNNITIIDIDYIFRNSVVGKKINKEAVDNRNKLIKQNQKLEADLTKQKNDILSKKNILEKNEFDKKVISHQKKVQEHQVKKNKQFKELNEKNINLTKNFMKKFDQVLVKYASENKIYLIIKKDAIIISDSNLDITKDVLKMVDKEIKKIN